MQAKKFARDARHVAQRQRCGKLVGGVAGSRAAAPAVKQVTDRSRAQPGVTRLCRELGE